MCALTILIGLALSINTQKVEICLPWDQVKIPIYADELRDKVIDYIYQDFEKEDHLYEVFIIDKSCLRFNIEYRDLYDPSQTIKSGWVDKKYSGVNDRWYYDETGRFIKLFTAPNNESEFIKIRNTPVRPLTVIDYQNGFLYVIFDVDGTIYKGWIDRFCPNILDNCT